VVLKLAWLLQRVACHFSPIPDCICVSGRDILAEMAARHKSAVEIEAGDESKLAELGYAQELKRDWSVLHNFGVSFSIISVITGITTLFRYAVFVNQYSVDAIPFCTRSCSATTAMQPFHLNNNNNHKNNG
jgi:hypothetical protein